MAIDVNVTAQIFTAEFQGRIFEKEDWLLESRDFSRYVVGNTVHYPYADIAPDVIIERNSASLTAQSPNAGYGSFRLREYQSLPTRLNWSDELLTNYDLRAEVLNGHLASINKVMALDILYAWLFLPSQTDNFVLSTGASRPATVPGATGNRKAITYQDILKLQRKLIEQEVPYEPGAMNMLIPAALMEEIMALEEFKRRDYFPIGTDGSTPKNGAFVIGMLAGANVWVRSRSLYADSSGYIKDVKYPDTPGFVPAEAEDCNVIALWHADFVCRAISPESKVNVVPYHGGVELSATAVGRGAALSVSPTQTGIVYLAEAFVA